MKRITINTAGWFLLACCILLQTSCGEEEDPSGASSHKDILSFVFQKSKNSALSTDVTGTIDQDAGSIEVTLPGGTAITALTPTMTLSPKAVVSPAGSRDFTSPVVYTVIAEDKSSKQYTVTVETEAPSMSQYDILVAIYEANPGSSLTWNIYDEDISAWDGVTTNAAGMVTELYITTRALSVLPPEIAGLTSLERMSLHFNQLTVIPEEIGELTGLKYLDLSTNQQLTAVPAAIGHLTGLKELYISNAALNAIPEEIGNLTALTYLDLSSNKITVLPSSIGQLTRLTTLRVNNNAISVLPEEVANLSALKTLQAGNNKLNAVPSALGQLEKLENLELQINDLTQVPKEIGSLANLQYLILMANNLTEVPNEFGALVTLKVLDLRTNPISSIPEPVCNLKNSGTNVRVDGDLCK